MAQLPKILLIDDDTEFSRLFAHIVAEFFTVESLRGIADEKEFTELCRSGDFALIAIDIHLEGQNGLQLRKLLLSAGIALPVVILTSDISVETKIAGFRLAIEDYIEKSMLPQEIVARLNNALRKTAAKSVSYSLDGARICSEPPAFSLGEVSVKLSPIEFKIMLILLREHPNLVSRPDMLRFVWGAESVDEKTLNTHVYNLNRLRLQGWSYTIVAYRGSGLGFAPV